MRCPAYYHCLFHPNPALKGIQHILEILKGIHSEPAPNSATIRIRNQWLPHCNEEVKTNQKPQLQC